MGEKKLQWHTAFQAALQIELAEERKYLQFQKEYNLTQKPLQIDTLIIKVEPGRKLKKKLGRFLRQYNVVEYKSPEDYLSVNDFYKVSAYACLYQSDTAQVEEIPPDRIYITMVSNRYPGKMIRHLVKMYGAEITEAFPGIYYVSGLIFPLQILVNKELPPEENLWLSRLRQDLNMEDISLLAKAYKGNDRDPLYAAVMDLLVRANRKQYEEGKDMCDALRELFADELEEREKEGREKGKAEAVLELLEDLGSIPKEVYDRITGESDLNVLTRWHKAAARAESMESFIKGM